MFALCYFFALTKYCKKTILAVINLSPLQIYGHQDKNKNPSNPFKQNKIVEIMKIVDLPKMIQFPLFGHQKAHHPVQQLKKRSSGQ